MSIVSESPESSRERPDGTALRRHPPRRDCNSRRRIDSDQAALPGTPHAPPVSRLERLVDEASPLSDDQRERIAVIAARTREPIEGVLLHAENRAHPNAIVPDLSELTIWGVVTVTLPRHRK